MQVSKVTKDDSAKHQVGGSYSISQNLKDAILNETIEGNDEDEDVLQKKMKERSLYNKEDEYHKRRLDNNRKRTLEDQENGSDVQAEKQLMKKKKSRWDIQSYSIPETSQEVSEQRNKLVEVPNNTELQFFKPSDKLHFALALDKRPVEELTEDERNKKSFLLLLLNVKNGNTHARKYSMKQLVEKCDKFGPKITFDCTLPVLLDRSLEDQERHLIIKVIDKMLYKLGPQVQPFTKEVLNVVAPLLIDEDPIARITGSDIISNLASATGLVSMLQVLRADIDNEDEYLRNVTTRVLAIVAKSVSVSQMIPFINAACHSTKSWRSRHSGIKIVQQISLLLGIGELPYLVQMIQCVSDGLTDEHTPVKLMAANTLSTLAQNSYPYGIEAFNVVLEQLWIGIRSHRGKVLAAFLKCLGSIIPLMDPEYAGYYTTEVMRIIQREFNSPDVEMKKTVLFVLQKCSQVETVTPKYLREEIGPSFFQSFWARRTALDQQLNKMVTYTTVVLAEKIGSSVIIEHLLTPLRDESEPFRIMAIHAVDRVVRVTGTAELNERLESRLIDALLIAFQEQTTEDSVIFRGFGTVAASLDKRMKPFLSPIVSTILNQLRHKDKLVRQNAADLCNILVPVIKNCGEIEMLNKLNIILYESLGEMYPEVLGSIIKVMGSILSVSNLEQLQPPVNQILPSLTPILRNNNIKVQLNTVNMIGYVAQKGPSYVPPKEWMRVCFELLELLKSTNKRIRKAANASFGYIAKAVGPQDVIVVLLNNLKVQERQLRVCTAVAIGIVARSCGPYTIIPSLMNEYKTPETNVQNGILKAMTFIFEYIEDLAEDYLYIIAPLLEDALTDRDLVHRQTASTVIKHIALFCSGSGNEDVFIHILNLLIPNIFETSPHVIVRILEGLEALSYAVGPGIFMNYIWAGLFHPAKNVRKAFWKVYNTAYINHLDALVPFYPINNDESLKIEELEWVL